jgi:histone H3/H4
MPNLFENHIQRVFKNVLEQTYTSIPIYGNSIVSFTKTQISNALNIICLKIIKISIELAKYKLRKTINENDITNAVNIVYPGELLKNFIRFNVSINSSKDFLFPINLIKKIIKSNIDDMILSKKCPNILSVALEYICAEILTISIVEAHFDKKARINTLHLESAIRKDKEINNVFKNITFSTNSFTIPKEIFQQFVNKMYADIKISKNVLLNIQSYIEQYIKNIIKSAKLLYNHTGRVFLKTKDLNFILKNICYKEHNENSLIII